MHEATIAQSLLDAIIGEAKNQKGKPVAAKITCGAFGGINAEVLNFAFDALSTGTVCQGLKLTIEQKPIQGHCNKCDKVFTFNLENPACTNCNSNDFSLLPDAPLVLEEIEFEGK
jgi:hydrogenase nickel incorporation protein HypA/HybF